LARQVKFFANSWNYVTIAQSPQDSSRPFIHLRAGHIAQGAIDRNIVEEPLVRPRSCNPFFVHFNSPPSRAELRPLNLNRGIRLAAFQIGQARSACGVPLEHCGSIPPPVPDLKSYALSLFSRQKRMSDYFLRRIAGEVNTRYSNSWPRIDNLVSDGPSAAKPAFLWLVSSCRLREFKVNVYKDGQASWLEQEGVVEKRLLRRILWRVLRENILNKFVSSGHFQP
jgi:hypothetical protein